MPPWIFPKRCPASAPRISPSWPAMPTTRPIPFTRYRSCGAPTSWKKCTKKFRRFPPMTEMEIQAILKQQREYFAAGHTLSAQSRLAALKKLKAALQSHEADLAAALKQDLGKSATESYMCET